MKLSNLFILFALLNVLFNSAVKAQMPMDGTDFILDKLRLNKGNEGINYVLYGDIQGDPFIFKDFQKGTLVVQQGKKFNINVRYDMYAEQMHLKDSVNMIYAIIHPEKVQLIEVGTYRFIYSPYLNSPKDDAPAKSSYFIIKTEGKCSLLVKKNIRVQDAEPATLYKEAKPAKFVPTADSYFLKNDGSSALRIKNFKDLLSVLADKSDVIEKYVSLNKLDVKEIGDLVKIVTYYNSL